MATYWPGALLPVALGISLSHRRRSPLACVPALGPALSCRVPSKAKAWAPCPAEYRPRQRHRVRPPGAARHGTFFFATRDNLPNSPAMLAARALPATPTEFSCYVLRPARRLYKPRKALLADQLCIVEQCFPEWWLGCLHASTKRHAVCGAAMDAGGPVAVQGAQDVLLPLFAPH